MSRDRKGSEHGQRGVWPSLVIAASIAVGLGGCSLTGAPLPALETLTPAPAGAPRQGETAAGRSQPAPLRKGELSPRESAEACLAAAQRLEIHGRDREAIVLYERARHFDASVPVAARLAVLYDRQNDFERAWKEYQRALSRQPDNPDLLNDFGYFHYQRGQFELAEQSFRKTLQLAPQHERAWINLGLTLGAQGRYDECLDAFSRVLSPASAHSNLGVVLVQQGQLEQAAAAFRQAQHLEPSLDHPRAILAHLQHQPPGATRLAAERPQAAPSGDGAW